MKRPAALSAPRGDCACAHPAQKFLAATRAPFGTVAPRAALAHLQAQSREYQQMPTTIECLQIGRGGAVASGASQTEACGHVQRAPQRQTMLTGGITPCENGWPGGGGDGPAPVCGVGTTSGGTFAPRGCAPWPRSWAAVPPAPLVALLPTPRPPTAGSPVAPQLTAAYPEACAPTGALSPPPFLEHTCRLKEATSLT